MGRWSSGASVVLRGSGAQIRVKRRFGAFVVGFRRFSAFGLEKRLERLVETAIVFIFASNYHFHRSTSSNKVHSVNHHDFAFFGKGGGRAPVLLHIVASYPLPRLFRNFGVRLNLAERVGGAHQDFFDGAAQVNPRSGGAARSPKFDGSLAQARNLLPRNNAEILSADNLHEQIDGDSANVRTEGAAESANVGLERLEVLRA